MNTEFIESLESGLIEKCFNAVWNTIEAVYVVVNGDRDGEGNYSGLVKRGKLTAYRLGETMRFEDDVTGARGLVLFNQSINVVIYQRNQPGQTHVSMSMQATDFTEPVYMQSLAQLRTALIQVGIPAVEDEPEVAEESSNEPTPNAEYGVKYPTVIGFFNEIWDRTEDFEGFLQIEKDLDRMVQIRVDLMDKRLRFYTGDNNEDAYRALLLPGRPYNQIIFARPGHEGVGVEIILRDLTGDIILKSVADLEHALSLAQIPFNQEETPDPVIEAVLPSKAYTATAKDVAKAALAGLVFGVIIGYLLAGRSR